MLDLIERLCKEKNLTVILNTHYPDHALRVADKALLLYGGGIYNEGTLILEGGRISGNTCEGLGGGIYNAYILIIQGGEVTGNTAKENAGGVFNYRSGSMSANPRSGYRQ